MTIRPNALQAAVMLAITARLALNAVLRFNLQAKDSDLNSIRSRVFIHAAGYLDSASAALDRAVGSAGDEQESDLIASAAYLSTHWHFLRLLEHTGVLSRDTISLASPVATLLFAAQDDVLTSRTEDDIRRLSDITSELARAHRWTAENVLHLGEGLAVTIRAALQNSGGFGYLARYGDLPAW